MMKKNIFNLLACTIVLPTLSQAQSVYMPNYYKASETLDRMETLNGAFSEELHLTSGPLSQLKIGQFLFQQKSNVYTSNLSNVDMYLANKMLYAQPEWLGDLGGNTMYQKAQNKLAPFYNNPVNLYEYNSKDFFFSINPKLGLQYMYEDYFDGYSRLNYAAGLELKSTIGKRVGLFFDYTYNQENPGINFQDYEYHNKALPGVGKYKVGSNVEPGAYSYNYHLLRGHINVRLLKDYINITAGYGQHKIGDGIRSLMLNDFAEASWFAKLSTQIWKIKYQNLYSVYQPQTIYKGYAEKTNEFKYATTHHLSVNLFKWLNVGLFETVMFGRTDRYEFGYVNPIIFYRSVERGMGSPDKVIIGLNAKAIPTKGLNVYGQFILNEFSASEFFGSNQYWGNKWGAQLGLKYYDIFNVSNWDMQLEGNVVRPYTYSANVKMGGQILTNYSHYNQALAHPLGSGFRELIMNMSYQPTTKLKLEGRLMYYNQTIDNGDSSTSNGGNILKNYDGRNSTYGVPMINSEHSRQVWLANLNIGYEAMRNTYFDLGATYKQFGSGSLNTFNIYAGFRMNLNRRDYAIF